MITNARILKSRGKRDLLSYILGFGATVGETR
jgi:hypothetical protein